MCASVGLCVYVYQTECALVFRCALFVFCFPLYGLFPNACICADETVCLWLSVWVWSLHGARVSISRCLTEIFFFEVMMEVDWQSAP